MHGGGGVSSAAVRTRTALRSRRSLLPLRRLAVLLACTALTAACGSSTHSSSGSTTSTSTPAAQSATTQTGVATAPTTIEGSEIQALPPVSAPTGPPPTPAHAATVDRAFLQTVFNDAQRMWSHDFAAAGIAYVPAQLVLFASAVHSGCGPQQDVGPFYCPANRTVYLDLSFFDLLARQAGVGGFAQAYIVGHEIGHHLQHLLGIDVRVAAANHVDPSGENARSVRVELQADCLSGVWAHSVYRRGELTTADINDALKAAALVGDDVQRRAAGKPVDPGLFTHGSAAQRQQWLAAGFDSGKPESCDTLTSP